ncbi:hypothetical protein [Winogradskyella sp. PE311]|uniref:hypothetical protein n=1 Tax=Winogradskyella sp. PE311 TaxID=3366943 RepID=UPI00397F1204
MIILIVNSDLDNSIITCFVAVIASMFLIKGLKQKLKSIKFSIHSFQNDDLKNHISNYALNFENNIVVIKSFGIKTKFTAILVTLIIIVFPLYEFIETLKPQSFIADWSCFPN